MSTLYDALRKAEAENKKAAGFEEKSPEIGKPITKEGMPESTKAVALFIAVIIVFAIAFYRIKNSVEVPLKPGLAQAAMAPASPGTAATSSTKPQRAPGTYGLDGVIDAGVNSMAIVNGKLLKVGETIDTLTLEKISPKEVELSNSKDNSTVILKIN